MSTWERTAKLVRISGTTYTPRREISLELEQGGRTAHFRYYWTEDVSNTTSKSDGTTVEHHLVAVDVDDNRFEPWDLMQALANTFECIWEILFLPENRGGFQFNSLTRLRELTEDGRIPVFISNLGELAGKHGEHYERSPGIGLNRTAIRANRIELKDGVKATALTSDDATLHELFHLIQTEYLGTAARYGMMSESQAAFMQRQWRGYRAIPTGVARLFDGWDGAGSIYEIDPYRLAEFWDMIGRKLSKVPYGARFHTPLCTAVDARKDIYPGLDVVRVYLQERARLHEPENEYKKTQKALSNTANRLGWMATSDDMAWEFLTKDWSGVDTVAAKSYGDGRLKLYRKSYHPFSGSASYLNVFEMPVLVTAEFNEGQPLVWKHQEGRLTSAPSVVRFNNHGRKQEHIFSRSEQGDIQSNIGINDTWTGWHRLAEQLPGNQTITSAPVAINFKKALIWGVKPLYQHELHLFARGTDSCLLWTCFDGMRWRTVSQLPFVKFKGHPAVVSIPKVSHQRRTWELHIFVWGDDDCLKTSSYQMIRRPPFSLWGWKPWQDIGTFSYTSPPAAAFLDHSAWVFIRDKDKHLRAFCMDENSRNWTGRPDGIDLGGNLKSGPSVAVVENDSGVKLYLFASRNNNGDLKWCRLVNNHWSDWTNI